MKLRKLKFTSTIFIACTFCCVVAVGCSNGSKETNASKLNNELKGIDPRLRLTDEYKKHLEKAIAEINAELSSDSLNPEEIHELIITRTNIIQSKCAF
ncbi:MAG: hypothetical protein HDT07_01095 [Bacteroidales bacterium]|nr:hypothetical protein [Bacteroidales bacterium]